MLTTSLVFLFKDYLTPYINKEVYNTDVKHYILLNHYCLYN